MTEPMPWRLQLAGMAMQAFLHDEMIWDEQEVDHVCMDSIAKQAFVSADTLLSEHSKSQSDESEMSRTIKRLERRTEHLRNALSEVIDGFNDGKFFAVVVEQAESRLNEDSEVCP